MATIPAHGEVDAELFGDAGGSLCAIRTVPVNHVQGERCGQTEPMLAARLAVKFVFGGHGVDVNGRGGRSRPYSKRLPKRLFSWLNVTEAQVQCCPRRKLEARRERET